MPATHPNFLSLNADLAATRALERQLSAEILSHSQPAEGASDEPFRSEKGAFLNRIQEALEAAKKSASELAVIVISLDGIPDARGLLGMREEESFVLEAGYAIKRRLRAGDSLVFLGGAEYGVVMPKLSQASELVSLMPKLQEAVMSMRGPGLRGLSAGLALSPRDSGEACALYSRAMVAMKQARLNGGACSQFYDRETHERLLATMRSEVELRLALRRGEFSLAYQPVLALESGHCPSAEALLRWSRPGSGSVPPSEFIPQAEACGLICEIGAWVVRQAVSDLGRLKAWGFEDFRIAVNLSPRQFAEPGLLWTIRRALSEYEVDPSCLGVEVTESCAVHDMAFACGLLDELRGYGVQVLMDDFGTGYSSLSHLRRFPLDVLKLDKSFIDELDKSAQDATIVSSVVALAHTLGLQVTAEGVESAAQRSLLEAMGCDQIQGYLVSRPVPFHALRQFLKAMPPSPKLSKASRAA